MLEQVLEASMSTVCKDASRSKQISASFVQRNSFQTQKLHVPELKKPSFSSYFFAPTPPKSIPLVTSVFYRLDGSLKHHFT